MKLNFTFTNKLFTTTNYTSFPLFTFALFISFSLGTIKGNAQSQDSTIPSLTCFYQVNSSIPASGISTIDPYSILVAYKDKSSIQSATLSQSSFDRTDLGENTVTLSITNMNGLTTTCSSSILIVDKIAPEINCHEQLNITLPTSGDLNIKADDILLFVKDNCSIQSIELSQTNFDQSDIGQNTVTVTTSDQSGNISSCTSQINIADQNHSSLACFHQVNTELPASGIARINPYSIISTYDDNFEIQSVSLSQTNFDYTHLGENPVTLTITDIKGNNTSCTSNVMVVDESNPTVICHDRLNVSLPAQGYVNIDTSDLIKIMKDNSGISTVTLSQSSFDRYNLGHNSVTVNAVDMNGNTGSCSTQLYIWDKMPPTCSKADTMIQISRGICDAFVAFNTPSAADNDGIDSIFQVNGLLSGDIFPIGSSEVVFKVVDYSGNSNTCAFNVIVTGDNRDDDNDGILNNCDNCPTNANPNQEDKNGNGIGDKCEVIRKSALAKTSNRTDFTSQSLKVFPNPFYGTLNIDFSIDQAMNVNIEVFNLQGQKIRSLVSERVDAGNHSYSWDATDNNHSALPSGLYLIRLSAGETLMMRKVTLQR